MEKEQITKLHKLSRQEKFEIVHMLWDDIAKEQERIPVPDEHQKIINNRIEKVKNGTAVFKNWDDVKKKYKSGG